MTKTKKTDPDTNEDYIWETDVLKNKLREPTPKDRVKFRVGRKSMDNKSAHMLAYVDARYVQDRLDDIMGAENWSNSYRMINDVLFCDITITFPSGEIVTKSDCGTESNVEKQKGQSSDAFKRAAVMLGIGRDLYDVGNNYSMWADLNEKGYPDNNWKPQGWGETPQRHGKTDEDSAVPAPTTPQPEAQKQTTQQYADEVIERASENAPEEKPKTIAVNEKPLKEGTPPEDEYVMVKNLESIRETNASYLLLPDGFVGDRTSKEDTGNYWVAKSLIKSSEVLMNGKMNVEMVRWIAKKAGYNSEEVASVSNDTSVETPAQAPENPVKDDDLPF